MLPSLLQHPLSRRRRVVHRILQDPQRRVARLVVELPSSATIATTRHLLLQPRPHEHALHRRDDRVLVAPLRSGQRFRGVDGTRYGHSADLAGQPPYGILNVYLVYVGKRNLRRVPIAADHVKHLVALGTPHAPHKFVEARRIERLVVRRNLLLPLLLPLLLLLLLLPIRRRLRAKPLCDLRGPLRPDVLVDRLRHLHLQAFAERKAGVLEHQHALDVVRPHHRTLLVRRLLRGRLAPHAPACPACSSASSAARPLLHGVAADNAQADRHARRVEDVAFSPTLAQVVLCDLGHHLLHDRPAQRAVHTRRQAHHASRTRRPQRRTERVGHRVRRARCEQQQRQSGEQRRSRPCERWGRRRRHLLFCFA
eukprot:Rhum_TRINITY_DN4932_c0_g1::Rhum_TRINITY_DN4932_c0_g1_i1::g.16150::m.16150